MELYYLNNLLQNSQANLDKKITKDLPLSTSSEVYLLFLLLENKQAPSFLAKDLGISKGRMTHLVDNLIQKDLLYRENDNEDKRRQKLCLTADGNQLAQKCRSRILQLEEDLNEKIGKTRFDLLEESLKLI